VLRKGRHLEVNVEVMTGGKMIIYRPKEKKDTIVHSALLKIEQNETPRNGTHHDAHDNIW
jgi:hypothetical protein